MITDHAISSCDGSDIKGGGNSEKNNSVRVVVVVVVFYLSDMPEDFYRVLHKIHECLKLTGPAIDGL